MKKGWFFVATALLSGTVFAQMPRGPGQQDPARFAAAKQQMVDRMQARIQLLQQAVSCVQNAQDPAALRLCREQQQAAMQQERRPMGGPGPRN